MTALFPRKESVSGLKQPPLRRSRACRISRPAASRNWLEKIVGDTFYFTGQLVVQPLDMKPRLG
jgi:hypothetical protein